MVTEVILHKLMSLARAYMYTALDHSHLGVQPCVGQLHSELHTCTDELLAHDAHNPLLAVAERCLYHVGIMRHLLRCATLRCCSPWRTTSVALNMHKANLAACKAISQSIEQM